MNKIDRLKSLVRYAKTLGIVASQEEFGQKMGYTNPSAFSQVINGKSKEPKDFTKRMCSIVPLSSLEWLETGAGQMILDEAVTQTITTNNGLAVANNGGSINYNTSHNDYEVPYAEQIPVVPPTIVRQAGVDILEYVQENMNKVEKSSVIVNDMELTTWIPMPDDCMAPEIQKGDRLGLWAYPRGHENPIPGKIYAVDTMSNGTIVRYLFITPEGDYLLRSQNPQLYPDFVVKKSDVIAIYKKLISVRI